MMKKVVSAVLLLITVSTMSYAAFRCQFCNGTGFDSLGFTCFHCKGTGQSKI